MPHFYPFVLSKGPYILSRTWKQPKGPDTDSGHLCADEAMERAASIALRHQMHELKLPVTQPRQL